jgi:hypothetical protein
MPEVIVSLSLDEMKNVTEIPILTDNFHNFTILSLSAGKSEQKILTKIPILTDKNVKFHSEP